VKLKQNDDLLNTGCPQSWKLMEFGKCSFPGLECHWK